MTTDLATRSRLMLMMFLQFFIWGAWWTTVGNYMRSHGMTDFIYVAYMSCPTGSIVAPFLFGAIADRFFPVQKVLGTLHLLSSAFLVAVMSAEVNLPALKMAMNLLGRQLLAELEHPFPPEQSTEMPRPSYPPAERISTYPATEWRGPEAPPPPRSYRGRRFVG